MADLEALLEQVRAASLVDAMGRRHHHRCHVLDLVSPTPDRRLFGPVVTMGFAPHRADLPDPPDFASLFYRAIEDAPEGAVLVLASGGHPHASLGGGTKLSRAADQGLSGVLADGRLRDFQELRAYPFATYCRGETPLAGGGEVMPLTAGEPVVFDRITVVPGDFAYADPGGAVIIPSADLEEVLAAAAEIEAEDRRTREEIRREDPERVRREGSSER